MLDVHVVDGHVPVSQEDLEPALFLALEGLLVGEKFLLDRLLHAGRGEGRFQVLENDGDLVVPAAVLGGMIARSHGRDSKHPAGLDLLAQHGEMILLEEPEKLVGMAPFRLVVILDDEGLLRRRYVFAVSLLNWLGVGVDHGLHLMADRHRKD